jgi:predicted double-glycine peptidase
MRRFHLIDIRAMSWDRLWVSRLTSDVSKWIGRWRAAGGLGLVLLLFWSFDPAGANRPIRSVLEIRRERVMIQKWDLSCGAAALGTLLRYQFGEPVTEKEIARSLMSRGEYVGHPELVQLREGFSLLDLKRYVQAYGAKAARSNLPSKKKSIRPQVADLRSGPSRIASHSAKRSASASTRIVSIYKGEGLGQLDLNDLIERAPIMVPINALGYNHFVVFRGVMGNRVLVADPAWGNRTMTIDKFQRMWLDYGEPMGHVAFVIARADGRKLPNRLQPKPSEFVMLQ